METKSMITAAASAALLLTLATGCGRNGGTQAEIAPPPRAVIPTPPPAIPKAPMPRAVPEKEPEKTPEKKTEPWFGGFGIPLDSFRFGKP